MYERNERSESDERQQVERTRSGISPALVGFIVLAILAIVFVVQNPEKAEIELLFWGVTASLWVVILISIAIGVLLDRLFGIWWRRRRRD